MSSAPKGCCCIRTALPAIVVLSLFTPTQASAYQEGPLLKDAVASFTCATTYSRAMFHAAARSAVRDPVITTHERAIVRKVVRCQRSAKSRRNVRFHWKRYSRSAARKRTVVSLTPYQCPNGTRWAIPCAIVMCESHGSWSAYNPSGASGPYQLLAKGAPMPADTAAKRLTHHRIASNLYAGGAGRSHWVC